MHHCLEGKMKYHGKARVFSFIVILCMLLSALGITTQGALAAPQDLALQFDGTNDYVTFGAATGPSGLNAQEFTLETWFYWTGGGVTTSTGTGGLTTVIPLVAKGRGESETTTLNVNYFLGISGGKLGADFEAYSGGQNY